MMRKHLRAAIVTSLGIVMACLAVAACAPCPEPTIVLVMRHAESAGDSLTAEGITRSQEMVHVAEDAGVKAIFVTEATRTRQTAEPLSRKLGIPLTTFTSTLMLYYDILAHFSGQTVLVVAHSVAGPSLPAVSDVIQQLGGDPDSCDIDGRFDNLCLVIVYQREPRRANVVNLRFAAYCAKDGTKGECR